MWFPQKERALATGIFNSGTSIGVIVSAWYGVDRAALGLADGRSCSSALIGLVWLYFWQIYFDVPERQKRLGTAELELHPLGPAAATEKSLKVPWTTLLRYREIWPFVIGKFITDPVWWFYLFWLPTVSRARARPARR